MNISKVVRSSITSASNYFRQSSWQGRTLQLAAAVSVVALLYLFLSRSRRLPPSSPLDKRVTPKQDSNGTAAISPPLSVPKPAPDSIQSAPAEIEELKDYFKVFETSILEALEYCQDWTSKVGKGENAEASTIGVIRRFIPGLESQISQRMTTMNGHPSFQGYSWEAWKQCLQEQIDLKKSSLSDICKGLKAQLERLQRLDQSVQAHLKNALAEQLKACPHHSFTDFPGDYYQYLSLNSDKAFSAHLNTQRSYLSEVGFRTIEDIQLLRLSLFIAPLEKLRRLSCCLKLTGYAPLNNTIKSEVQNCLKEIQELGKVLPYLKDAAELESNLKQLEALFRRFLDNPSDGKTLDEIEQKDIERQRIQLKGYIHQQYNRNTWIKLYQKKKIQTLSKIPDIQAWTAYYCLDNALVGFLK